MQGFLYRGFTTVSCATLAYGYVLSHACGVHPCNLSPFSFPESNLGRFDSKVRKDLDVDNPVQAARRSSGDESIIKTSSVGAQQLTSYGAHYIDITSTPSCTYGLHGVIQVEALSGFLPSHPLPFETSSLRQLATERSNL
ncbi:hypothetical protein M2480_003184 [Parabacteroides sp. PFB2-12]|nr:hypothetical protein [Parabacteroides sp. PM6-13]MDH6392176.1 hypothetical protein [Parabacteroides sp. PFB2-12]